MAPVFGMLISFLPGKRSQRRYLMIVTDLKHMDDRVDITHSLNKAFEFLRLHDLQKLPDGRVEIDGERVFALVQRYETITTDEPKFECHKKYIDVQYIVSGEEIIGWAPAERVKITDAYDAAKDICFGTVEKGKRTLVYLQAGQFAVMYPEDGHAPKIAAGTVSSVMKIVIKVATAG
jgi:YhcH/YjgK/YiaL family protein